MTTSIKLSQETQNLLKVASSINNSIRIDAGNRIRTIAETGAIILDAEVPETFPETFSIYELNKFLSVVSLESLKDGDLIFDGKNYVDVKKGKVSIKYKFTDSKFTTHPGKEINLPNEQLSVDLTADELKNMQKIASILGHKYLEFRVQEGKAYMLTTSPDLGDASSDSLVELADVPGANDGSYKLAFNNLILPNGDYKVTIGGNGRISKFEHKTSKIVVFVATEIQ